MSLNAKICRTCLKKITKMKLISLFIKTKVSDNKLTNAQLIMACSSVKIKKGDQLPQNICLFCQYKLSQMYKFKLECEKADKLLHAMFLTAEDISPNPSALPPNDVAIKLENGQINDKIDIDESKVETDSDDNVSYTSDTTVISEVNKPLSARAPISCAVCNEIFYDSLELRQHLKQSHSTIKCRMCNRQFNKHRNLKIHLSVMHKPKPHVNKLITSSGSSGAASRYERRCSTICPVCSKTLHTLADLKAHLVEAHKTIACSECGKIFNQYRYLRRHMKMHAEPLNAKHLCPHCGRVFTEMGNLNAHIRIHTGEKPYACKECGRCFVQWSSLRSHKLTHSSVRNFACELCGKAFVRERSLIKHKITHSEERNFPCKLCDKRFKLPSTLKEHMIIHTGVKKYKCDVCNKAFGFKKNLVVHIRTHTGEKPYVCFICNQGFSQGHCLRTHHLRSHSTGQPTQDDNIDQAIK